MRALPCTWKIKVLHMYIDVLENRNFLYLQHYRSKLFYLSRQHIRRHNFHNFQARQWGHHMDPDRTLNPTADPDRRTLVADRLQIKIWQNDADPTGTGSVSGSTHWINGFFMKGRVAEIFSKNFRQPSCESLFKIVLHVVYLVFDN
jgi:hypothetical protein